MEMSEEEFDALTYIGYGITLPHRGGSASDDVAEDRDVYNLSEFERESFYTLFTLIRTLSGRAITVDAQGYNYMRYTGLLSHYKTSMATDCTKATQLLLIEEQEANAEKQASNIKATKEEVAEKIHIENIAVW